jgi:hypothetical protein
LRTATSLLVVALAVSASAPAQTPRSSEEFGTDDESILIVSAASLISESGGIGALGELRWHTGEGPLRYPIESLPNGARITRITYYFHDTDPAEDLFFDFCRSRFDADIGVFLNTTCAASGDSADIDGDSYAVDDREWPIHYRRDVDGNGSTDIEYSFIRVFTFGAAEATAIRAIEIRWKRTVRPAPPAATFGDVPTNHPFFQFVEALADSGITAGCGGGNYCPDQPLTRGQMAVFLAKALGLHWPWDAP